MAREFHSLVGDGDECRMLLCPVELRAASESDVSPVLEGYGALFNQWTQIGGDQWGFMERVAPGAFAQTIREDDIRSFFNHDSNQVLGRNTTKTLDLAEDDKGLRVVVRPPETNAARDVVTLIKRGDVNGMSFVFRTMKEEWKEPIGKGELPKRTLLTVKLLEVGPVSLPAYPQTSIAARDCALALLDTLTRTGRIGDADRLRWLWLAQAKRAHEQGVTR